MTIGDVLAVTAAIAALGVCWTAAILLFALAFPRRAAAAQVRLTDAPGLCLVRGLVVVLAGGLLALLCFNSPAGPVKLVSGVIAGGIGLAAAVGSAGAVRLMAERIVQDGAGMPPFASLTRAAVLYVLAGFLPVLGWFVILPTALFLSVGGAVSTLLPARIQSAPRHAEIEAAA